MFTLWAMLFNWFSKKYDWNIEIDTRITFAGDLFILLLCIGITVITFVNVKILGVW